MTSKITTVNPATGQPLRVYEATPLEVIIQIIEDVHKAQELWKKQPLARRARIIKKTATLLKSETDKLARIMSEEMGKPLEQAKGEIKKCAWVCDYYAQKGPAFLKDVIIKTEAKKAFVTYQPLGVLLAIMPWNFPYWQVLRFGIPALLAGNGIILKHAASVCACSLAIEDLLKRAGFPKNLFRSILVDVRETDAIVNEIIRHPLVQGVTFTGSTRAGRLVAEKAGRFLKKAVLELGGSDPYVILKDADIKKAATLCAASRLNNTGQSCIAAKRFIVDASIQNKFEKEFLRIFESKKFGDPFDSKSDLGPLARLDLRDTLDRQVQESVRKGAKLLIGGKIPADDGAYYPATILSGVKKGMPAYDEEIFGPVAAIITASNEKEAIRIANDTSYGLGSGIFSRNLKKAQKLAREDLQAGAAFVNSFVQSDPRLPFGGIKDSGFGRELGIFGIHEFVNIKSVSIQ